MHRFRTAVIGTAVAGALALGGVSTHASADPVATTASRPNTWACVAVSYVDVGACVRNPFHERPHPRDVVRESLSRLGRG